jgi:hypothetical protein
MGNSYQNKKRKRNLAKKAKFRKTLTYSIFRVYNITNSTKFKNAVRNITIDAFIFGRTKPLEEYYKIKKRSL